MASVDTFDAPPPPVHDADPRQSAAVASASSLRPPSQHNDAAHSQPPPDQDQDQVAPLPDSRDNKVLPSRRSSIFSLRPKSILTPSALDGPASGRSSSLAGPNPDSHRISLASQRAPSAQDSDGLKSRLLFGRSRMLRSSSVGMRSSMLVDPDDEAQNKERARHWYRPMKSTHSSTCTSDPASRPLPSLNKEPVTDFIPASTLSFRISAPLSAQLESEESSLEDSGEHLLTTADGVQVRPPSQELKERLDQRPDYYQKRPPPLRPKRPDELLIPDSEGALNTPQTTHLLPDQRLSAETFWRLYGSPVSPISPRTVPHPHRQSRLSPRHLASNSAETSESQAPSRAPPVPPRADRSRSIDNGEMHSISRTLATQSDWRLSNDSQRSSSSAHTSLQDQSSTLVHQLAIVTEEPEGTASHGRSAVHAKKHSVHRSVSSPVLPKMTWLSHRMSTDDSLDSPLLHRPESQVSDTLGEALRETSAIYGEDFHVAVFGLDYMDDTAHGSDLDSTWEEDIDYCYEHAAEANCEFDWGSLQSPGSVVPVDKLGHKPWEHKASVFKHHAQRSVDSTSTGDFEPFTAHETTFYHSPNLPATESLPDLDTRSAHTTSTGSIRAMTPASKLSLQSTAGLGLDIDVDASVSPPMDTADDAGPVYDEVLEEYHEFLMEAKSLPLGVRPKSKMRRDMKSRMAPTSAPTSAPVQFSSEKSSPETASTSSRSSSSASRKESRGPIMDLLVSRLTSPRDPSHQFSGEKRTRRGSPRPLQLRFLGQRKTSDELAPAPENPPIPARSLSRRSPTKASTTPQIAQTPAVASTSISPREEAVPSRLDTLPMTTYTPSNVDDRQPAITKTTILQSKMEGVPPSPRTPLFDIFDIEQIVLHSPSTSPTSETASKDTKGQLPAVPRRAPPPLPPPPPPPLKDPQHRRKVSREMAQLAAQSAGLSPLSDVPPEVPEKNRPPYHPRAESVAIPPRYTPSPMPSSGKKGPQSYSLFPAPLKQSMRSRFTSA